MTLNVDGLERSLLGSLKDQAGFAGCEANAAVIFALDEVCTTVITDELYAVARSIIWVFAFALESEPFDNGVEANIWLVPANLLLACALSSQGREIETYDLQMVESAARRSRETIMSNRYAPRYGVSW